MKKNTFKVPKEVELFQEDTNRLGQVNDGKNWYVTEEWVEKFKAHLNNMLPLAEKGDPVAQYNVAVVYMCGYLHASEQSSIKAHKSDMVEMSKWLERAARGGVITAIDNLISVGVGDESTRLRKIYNENKSKLENGPPPSESWERDMHKLYEIAYESS